MFGGAAGFVGTVVFIDTTTGAERVVEIEPPLPGISLAWLDEGTLILSLLDRSSAPLQLWLLSYPKGEFSRLTNDPNQYVGLSVTADRSRLVTARSEASFSIWTSDASATEWTQALPTTPQEGPIGFARALNRARSDPWVVARRGRAVTTRGAFLAAWDAPLDITVSIAPSISPRAAGSCPPNREHCRRRLTARGDGTPAQPVGPRSLPASA